MKMFVVPGTYMDLVVEIDDGLFYKTDPMDGYEVPDISEMSRGPSLDAGELPIEHVMAASCEPLDHPEEFSLLPEEVVGDGYPPRRFTFVGWTSDVGCEYRDAAFWPNPYGGIIRAGCGISGTREYPDGPPSPWDRDDICELAVCVYAGMPAEEHILPSGDIVEDVLLTIEEELLSALARGLWLRD